MILRILFCLLSGYTLGCFSTAYVVGRLNHMDIRKYGSGNAGTTNALRTLGWKAGALTYLGDFLKAIIPILLFREVLFKEIDYKQLLALYVGLGVVIGHCYPFWLHFKGGKGIAVTSGVMAAFHPLLIPIILVFFILTVGITRYVSLGSLVISVIFPIWIYTMNPGEVHMLLIGLLYTVSAFFMHRANIVRLMKGTENKIGHKVKVNQANQKDS